MALLSGSPRTATARSASDVELLEIDRQDFERLIAGDQVLARAVERLSHDRALNNLSAGTPGAASRQRPPAMGSSAARFRSSPCSPKL
jgi:CRP-like cAMP-binding protein